MVEKRVEVLFGLADVLRHQTAEIDAEERPAEFVRQHRGSEGLAGARGAAEERDRAVVGSGAPFADDGVPAGQVGEEFAQHRHLGFGKHEIVPGRDDIHACGSRRRSGLPGFLQQPAGDTRCWLNQRERTLAVGTDQPVAAQRAVLADHVEQRRGVGGFQTEQFLQEHHGGPGAGTAAVQRLEHP